MLPRDLQREYLVLSRQYHRIARIFTLEVTALEKLRSGWPGPFVKVEGCCD
jgi:hypothetical protein